MTAALPLTLDPLPEETWPSYLTRRAAQHHCTVALLADHLALRGPRGRWPGRYGVTIDPITRDMVAAQLRLTPIQVEQMHLARYDQLAIDLTGLSKPHAIEATRATVHAAWVWLAGSSYCPPCLVQSGGVWRLPWRLPWITSCPTHQVNLVGTCPACSGVPGVGNQFHTSAPTRLHVAPDGRRCTHPATPGGVCGADLSSAPTTPAGAARLARTQRFTALVNGHRGTIAGTSHTSLQTLRGWQCAIGIAVRLGTVDAGDWGRTHRWGNPPRDPDLVDTLHEAVQPLIDAPTPTKAADVLQTWCARAGIITPHAGTFNRITQPSAALQPVIDELLLRYGRAHTLIQRRLTHCDGTTVAALPWNLDDLPQLVWPCALPSSLQAHTRPDQLLLRAVVALTLARWQPAIRDWASAGHALGMPPTKARAWARHAYSSRWGLKDQLLQTAETLHPVLDQQPQRANWTHRPTLDGYGLQALRAAQQPRCRRIDPDSSWCPCTSSL